MTDDRRRRFEAQALPHLDAAYNLARWLTRSPADAEDLVQETMLLAYRSFDNVRGTQIRAWLLTILRNCHISAHRKAPPARLVPLPEENPEAPSGLVLIAEGPDPEGAAIGAEEGRQLSRWLAQLPEEFREVLVLRELEECSYREIAEIMGVPIGTVMSRLSRARRQLQQALTETSEPKEVSR